MFLKQKARFQKIGKDEKQGRSGVVGTLTSILIPDESNGNKHLTPIILI